MKVTTDSTALRSSLERVIRASAPNSPVPALSQVRIKTTKDTITLTCTNELMEIQGDIPAQVEKHGAVCVNAKKLLGLLPAEGEVTFKAETQATVKAGRSTYKLPLMPIEEFPSFPWGYGGEMRVDWGAFSAALSRCLPAVGKESLGKPALTGIEVLRTPQAIRFTAIDTHILVRSFAPNNEVCEDEFERLSILLKAAVVELLKLPCSEVAMFSADDSTAQFDLGDFRLATRLIAGRFPNCEAVLDREVKGGFVVGREELIAAVKRLAAVSVDDCQRVRLGFAGERLTLSANAKDLGEGSEEIPCRGDLNEAATILHGEQLLALLGVWSGDEMALGFEAANKPIHLYPMDGAGYHGVIMPLSAE